MLPRNANLGLEVLPCLSNSSTTGASLIASGRVPMTTITFLRSFVSNFLLGLLRSSLNCWPDPPVDASNACCDIMEKPGLVAGLKVDHTSLRRSHSGWRKVRFRTPPYNPIQDLSRTLCLRFPGQAFPRVGHPLLSQALQKIPIACEIAQNLFHLYTTSSSLVAGTLKPTSGWTISPGPP